MYGSSIATTSPRQYPPCPRKHLVHLLDQSVDLVFPIAQIPTLDKVLELPRPESTSRVAELKGPQEVARLLEVGSNGEDLMDQILHADDTILAEVVLDELVVGERDALLVDLAVSALVHKLAHSLQVRVAVGDPRFDNFQHLTGSFG